MTTSGEAQTSALQSVGGNKEKSQSLGERLADERVDNQDCGDGTVVVSVSRNGGESENASRLVWWLARAALRQMGRQPKPKVGDVVVEVTHLLGMARHRLGLLSAVGELLAIEEQEHLGPAYTIRTIEGKEQRWSNAEMVTIDEHGLTGKDVGVGNSASAGSSAARATQKTEEATGAEATTWWCHCGWKGTADGLSSVRGFKDRCPRCGHIAKLEPQSTEATQPKVATAAAKPDTSMESIPGYWTKQRESSSSSASDWAMRPAVIGWEIEINGKWHDGIAKGETAEAIIEAHNHPAPGPAEKQQKED